VSKEAEFVIFECENPDCRFRCPSNLTAKSLELCPLCARPMHAATPAFSNQKAAIDQLPANNPPIEVLLDNLRSTLNVGSIFRTSDGARVRKIHLCGTTPTPEHPKIAKTGLGAEWNLPWVAYRNGLDFISEVRKNGFMVISLEATPASTSIFSLDLDITNTQPILLVIGNEVSGVDPEILDQSDYVCSIPMSGIKSSLNVAVAFGIAVYTIQEYFSCKN